MSVYLPWTWNLEDIHNSRGYAMHDLTFFYPTQPCIYSTSCWFMWRARASKDIFENFRPWNGLSTVCIYGKKIASFWSTIWYCGKKTHVNCKILIPLHALVHNRWQSYYIKEPAIVEPIGERESSRTNATEFSLWSVWVNYVKVGALCYLNGCFFNAKKKPRNQK